MDHNPPNPAPTDPSNSKALDGLGIHLASYGDYLSKMHAAEEQR